MKIHAVTCHDRNSAYSSGKVQQFKRKLLRVSLDQPEPVQDDEATKQWAMEEIQRSTIRPLTDQEAGPVGIYALRLYETMFSVDERKKGFLAVQHPSQDDVEFLPVVEECLNLVKRINDSIPLATPLVRRRLNKGTKEFHPLQNDSSIRKYVCVMNYYKKLMLLTSKNKYSQQIWSLFGVTCVLYPS